MGKEGGSFKIGDAFLPYASLTLALCDSSPFSSGTVNNLGKSAVPYSSASHSHYTLSALGMGRNLCHFFLGTVSHLKT